MQNTTPKKRGRPKGSTKLKPGDYDPATDRASKVSGTMYLFADGSHTWADSAINANTIEQFKRNAYITARFNQLINLIFQDDLIVEIDGSDGLPDEDVATKIRKMIAVPKVDFNYQARQCFTGFFWHGFYPYNCVYSEQPDEDGWWSLDELRDLPAKSFDCEPNPSNGLSVVLKSELYPGICLMSDGEIHYFQKDERYGRVSELKYVKHAKPPNDFTNDIAGMPMFYPTIPLLNRLNFAWKCQIQK
jgi:hypothetical protein